MKKKLLVPILLCVIFVGGLSGCSKKTPQNADEALATYYNLADYNKTIKLITEYSFSNDEGTSENSSESDIKICGNEMSFTTDSIVKSTKEESEITNSISAYLYNDVLYYNINDAKIKEDCTVKNALYMLGIDFALFDKSYCDSIDIKNENGETTAVYKMNPDKVLLNWEDTFFTLQYGLGITASQIQTINDCTITIVTKEDKIISYEVNFDAEIEDGDGSVNTKYKTHMDFSDYGTTKVTPFENLDEYTENDLGQTGDESHIDENFDESYIDENVQEETTIDE